MRRLSQLSIALLLAAACREEGPITGAKPDGQGPVSPGVLVEGTVEKGPFVEGTVAVGSLDGSTAVATAIQDGLGVYALRVPDAVAYRVEATGRPYRETAGVVAAAPVTLRALHVRAGDHERVHVNVLTHLAFDRTTRLFEEGTELGAALARAGDEVHRALGVGVPFHRPALPASTGSMLGADDDDHAYLFAVAAVIDRAAGDEDLDTFLAAVSADLASDGELSLDLSVRLAVARRDVEADRVTAALRTWLERTGHGEVIVPDLRRILDGDGDGIPDRIDELRVEASRLSIVRTGAGAPDRVEGAGGAVLPACPPAVVEVFDREAGSLPLVSGAVAADGSFSFPFGTAEVSRPRLWVEAEDACGARSARVAIAAGVDEAPPTIVPDALSIVRQGLEAPDLVRADAGAVADGDGPVVAVWLAVEPEGPRIARATPAADGGFAEVPVGTADEAPARVWVEAMDKAGNLAPRVEIEAGRSTEPPVLDPARMYALRQGMGQVDNVVGSPGAVSGVCRPALVRLFDDPRNPPFVTTTAGNDGHVDAATVGTWTWTPPRIWAQPVDKCGVAGELVELEALRDLEAPVIDRTRVVLDLEANQVTGLVGAVADPIGVARVRILDAACAVPLVGAVEPPAPDGSFPAVSLLPGSNAVAYVCIEATDKAGNVSPRVRSRRVRAELTAAGVGAAVRQVPEVSVFSGVFDADPRTLSPGMAGWRSSRLSGADLTWFVQGGELPVAAEPEERDVPLAWRWLDLSLPATAAAAAPPVTGPILVRPMGDWPFMVTLRRVCGSAGCAAERRWEVAAVDGPPRREGMALAALTNDAVLAFGGTDGATRLADTWVFSPDEGWRFRAGVGGPAAAAAVRMVRDPARGRALLVAAVEGEATLQVWEYGTRWTQLAPASSPPFRTDFGLAADPVRGQVVLFGGRAADGTPLGDTWIWDGTAWSQRVVTAPSPRWGHGMAWFEALGSVMLRGGSGVGALDGWSWDGVRWSHLAIDGRDNGIGVAVVADPAVDQLYTFFNETPEVGPPHFTVDDEGGYSLDLLGPPEGAAGAIAWDPLLGTATLQGITGPSFPWAGMAWTWAGGRWQARFGPGFSWRATRTVVVDTHRGLRLELGGNDDGRGSALDESGHRSYFDVPAWPAGVTPRYVYDAATGRTIGVGGGASWALDALDVAVGAATWTPIAGGPAGDAELTFFPVRGRTVAYDGVGTWELEGDAWVATAPAPAACPAGRLLFDPAAGKLLKLAGVGCDLACTYDGAWSCGGAQAPPAGLAGAPDPASGTLLAHGVGGTRTWIREGATPHQRFAAQLYSVVLPAGAVTLGAEVALTAGGNARGADGGVTYGVDLLAWNWTTRRWVEVGGTSPGYGTPSSPVPAGGRLPPDAEPFGRNGRIWLLATPQGGSGLPGETGSTSTLTSRNLALGVEYLLP